MVRHSKTHQFLLAAVGLCLLAGCRVLRGPEPYGPTYVAPPGPIVRTPATPVPQQSQSFLQPSSQVTLNVSGPANAAVGDTVSYRISIRNCQRSIARDVTVTCPLPQGVTYASGSPGGTPTEQQVQWRLGDIPGCGTRTIEARFQFGAAGTINLCADVSTAGGTLTRQCALTSVSGAAPPQGLAVNVTAPEPAKVGDTASFRVVVTNGGQTPARGVKVTVDFDDGLVHPGGPSPIRKDLVPPELQPGDSQTVTAAFQVTRPGQFCTRVTVTAEGGLEAKDQACVRALGEAKMSVRQTGPMSLAVGGKGLFRIEVKNTGDQELTSIVVRSRFDLPLQPVQATQVDGRQVNVTRTGEQYELSSWTVAKLAPGQTKSFEVECKGAVESPRACGRVTVTSGEGLREEDVTCTPVVAAKGP